MTRTLLLFAVLFAAQAVSAAETKVTSRWAVLVGVDDYAYANDLEFCGADQFALFEQLKTSGFPEENVFILHTKSTDVRYQPSRANIERQLDLVFRVAEENDLLIVGFSGHGVHIDGKSYLCPSDANLEDPQTLISMDGIYDRLNACAAPFKLVIVDACRNDPRPGGQRSIGANDGTKALAESLKNVELPKGVVLLNSCAPGEVSWEEKNFGHGVFMHYVLEGLKGGADSGGDGSISLNELGEFVSPKTKAYVVRQFGQTQRPFFKGELSIDAMSYALLTVPKGGAIPAVVNSTGTTPTVPPLGVPSNDTARNSRDIRDTRFPARPEILSTQGWLGLVTVRPLYAHNVVLGVLPDASAASAGLQRGDVILAVGDTPVFLRSELDTAIKFYNAGDTVNLKIRRAGQELVVPAKLDPMPPDGGSGRFLAAAEAGIPFAMIEMLFRYGAHGKESMVCEKNEPEAVVWARKAIEAGEPIGWHELGYCITNGVGVERNEFEGLQTYERSRRELGPNDITGYYVLATFRIGNMHTEGRGVARDLVKGIEMIREAVNGGSAQATHRLGYLYETGTGVPRDIKKAMELYMEAAKYHYGQSETNIGWLIYSGTAFRRDYEAAANWYRSAALHGEPNAMYSLGQMYERGEGMTRNADMAQQWYKKAADLGHIEAKKELGGN